MWQLKKLSTNETLNEPQKLPENWGSIFGLQGVADKLDNLSWLGKPYEDMGWFVVGETQDPIESTEAELVWDRAKQLLAESDWSVLSDVPMTSGERALWIEYRRALREVRLQSGFPKNVVFPKAPE